MRRALETVLGMIALACFWLCIAFFILDIAIGDPFLRIFTDIAWSLK